MQVIRSAGAPGTMDGMSERPLLPGDVGGRPELLAHLEHVCAAAAGEKLMILVELLGLPHPADVYGTADDQVVAFVESRLAAALGEPASYYRLREPEFCVLVDDRPARDRSRLLHSLVEALEGAVDGFDVTSVFGVVRLPADSDEPRAALQLADERLNLEKRERGIETYAPFDPEPGDAAVAPIDPARSR